MELIRDNHIDVVLLDIILPLRDGISILEEIRGFKNDNRPSVIMLTAISNDNFINRSLELGASYFMLKPFDVSLLSKRIIEVYESKNKFNTNPYYNVIEEVKADPNNEETLDVYITNTLKQAGITKNLKGYGYLKTAVKLTIQDYSLIGSITKVLYPMIAKEHGTTVSCVERSIRHALTLAWDKKNCKDFYRKLGYFVEENLKPTNRSFIIAIVGDYKNMYAS